MTMGSEMSSVTTMIKRLVLGSLAALALQGCGGDDMRDLDAYVVEKRARPGGVIEPIPTFKAYEAFAYAATTMRSPLTGP